MKRAILVAAALAALAVPASASAGVYTNELGRCMLNAVSPEDKAVVMRAIFAAVSANPVVKSMSSVTPEQQDATSRAMVELMQRLMLKDCRKEAVVAIKNEGALAFTGSFELLGQIAGSELFSDSQVAAQFDRAAPSLDRAQWAALLKEAGVPANSMFAPQPTK